MFFLGALYFSFVAYAIERAPVPARDKEAAARFFDGQSGHFAPVRVNGTLTLLFDEEPSFERHH